MAAIKLIKGGVYLLGGKIVREKDAFMLERQKREAMQSTMAYNVLKAHNTGDEENLKLRFDAAASHDITYVGIIQTAKASNLKEFPISYTLTNCHNSLCAVGGTINEDDHLFGLGAAKRYGGNFVPPHLAVIHQYMREMEAKCGAMILGSDSHTRYGALGTMGVGEGGPEIVKQLLSRTYDIKRPETIAVYLKGKPQKGVGPHDVAIALCGAVFKNGFVKNKVLEFVGPGIKNLSVDYRSSIDTMTTETACLSSIWETDDKVEEYYALHGRASDYKSMHPGDPAYYDGAVVVDLSRVEPMIALPFHPSNAYTIREFLDNAEDLLHEVEVEGNRLLKNPTFNVSKCAKGREVRVSQGIIAGCAGGSYENIAAAAEVLKGGDIGCDEFALSVYPDSLPVYKCLSDNGYASQLMGCGAVMKTAFCGPCFGAGDTPANNGLSIRHTTRNFENREGSKPSEGQLSAVCLMDARSIAATAKHGGILTPATEEEYSAKIKKYSFDPSIYDSRVYRGFGKADDSAEIVYGENIRDWPEQIALPSNILMKVCSVLSDPVTTTDELIPSGETSSYRSNPERLATFALSRKDPEYVSRAKAVKEREDERRFSGAIPQDILDEIGIEIGEDTGYGSVVVARKPGDGSAREQAASCQRVLGGVANVAAEYATKRYRSNLMNWGMLPLLYPKPMEFEVGDYLYIENVREAVMGDDAPIKAMHVSKGKTREIEMTLGQMSDEEKKIILSGCLINYYKEN